MGEDSYRCPSACGVFPPSPWHQCAWNYGMGEGRLTMEIKDSQIICWVTVPAPFPMLLPRPTEMSDADPMPGSGWACCFGDRAPMPLPQSPSEVLPWALRRADAWVTKQADKTRNFQEGLQVLGFCFVLPQASPWLKLVNLTCSHDSNIWVVGFASGKPTHTVWKRKGRSTPFLSSQSLLSLDGLSSCPGGHVVLVSRFFPSAGGRAIVFLFLTWDLKMSLPVS